LSKNIKTSGNGKLKLQHGNQKWLQRKTEKTDKGNTYALPPIGGAENYTIIRLEIAISVKP
jgi:hypothetical protein